MVTPSNILAWKIPWTEEPGRLYSPWGRQELDTCMLHGMNKKIQGNPDIRKNLLNHLKGAEKQQGCKRPRTGINCCSKAESGWHYVGFSDILPTMPSNFDKNNKQLIIGIEKCFIWAKLRTTLITLRSCSEETWFSAVLCLVRAENITQNIIPQGFKNQIGAYPMSQRGLGTWGGSLIIKGGCPRKGGI